MTDRDVNGRFIKGAASPNPKGRPPKEISESVTALIDSVVTPDDWEKIIDKLASLALRGNMAAISALLDRRYGKPTETHKIGNEKGEALRIAIEYVNNPYPTPSLPSGAGDDSAEPKEV